MTSNETAILYGVPTPETAEILDWENPTIWIWVKRTTESEWELILFDKHESWFDKILYAPQMHEIARELPQTLPCTYGYDVATAEITLHRFDEICYTVNGEYIYWEALYDNPIEYGDSEAAINFNYLHLAEGYSQLYIKLREAGLLKKEAGNALD
jgi:hypothetical protein